MLLFSKIVNNQGQIDVQDKHINKYLQKLAVRDLLKFRALQRKRLDITEPIAGDYIEDTQTYIAHHWGKFFQDSKGGSFCLVSSSNASYSGGFTGNTYKPESLEPSGLHTLYAWTFSAYGTGANLGVYKQIKVRSWKLRKKCESC